MLHRAEFRPDPIQNVHPAVQMGSFIRISGFTRENIVNVLEKEDGTVVLFYWQEVYHR